MAWQGRRSNTNRTSVRVTGLFKTKRPGMMIGTARAEDIDKLIEKIKEARGAKKGLTFMLFKNDRGDGPAASLLVDVEQERQGGQATRPKPKPIEDDPFGAEDDAPEGEPEDPFDLG